MSNELSCPAGRKCEEEETEGQRRVSKDAISAGEQEMDSTHVTPV